jgi:hypothetical protein
MSKTFSGGQAIRVVVVTRTARSYPGASRQIRPTPAWLASPASRSFGEADEA